MLSVALLSGAEVLLILQGVLRWLDRFAQGSDLLQGIVEVFASLVDPVREQPLDVVLGIAVEGSAGVVGDGGLEGVEQVAVVDDVAVVLVVTVEPVDAADGLEEAVVLHLLVDVEVGSAGCVEAGQQLVDHDKQAHLARLVDEPVLHLLLEQRNLVCRSVLGLVEVVGQHLEVDVVLAEPLGSTLTGVFLGDVPRLWLVAGDDGALALEAGLTEQLVELARLVDGRANEHGVASTVHQPRLDVHVQQDVVHDLAGAGLSADDLLHRAPALLQLRLGQVGHALGLGLEPLIDLVGSHQLLVDRAGFVAQVQHDPVFDGLVELVGVDERAEGLDARFLVPLQERRTGEADEHRSRQEQLHGIVHLAGLGPVSFIDEDEQIALGAEVLGDLGLELSDEVTVGLVSTLLVVGAAELVDQGADQPLVALVESRE